MTTNGWDLTAPESLVLRDGPGANRAQAIKLGLLELLTRSSLRLVDAAGRNWRGRDQVEKILVRGTQPVPTSGALAPIAAAFHNTPEKRFPDGKVGTRDQGRRPNVRHGPAKARQQVRA